MLFIFLLSLFVCGDAFIVNTKITSLSTPHTNHPLHVSQFEYKFEDYHFDLKLNKELFAKRFVVIQDGKEISRGAENCYYKGTVKNIPGSLVAVSTCSGKMDGIMYANNLIYKIDSHKMSIYEADENTNEIKRMCDSKHASLSSSLLSANKKNPLSLSIKKSSSSSFHTESSVYYIELFLVNDYKQCTNTKFASFAYCTQYAYDITNQVSVLFEKLPSSIPVMHVTLVGIENWSSLTQIKMLDNSVVSGSSSMSDYLNAFTVWSAARVNDVPYVSDTMHLITGWPLEYPVVGLAWLSTICSIYSTGITQDTTGSKVFTAETLTHEMGHTIGASHDGYGNACPNSGYIMAGTGSVNYGSVSALTWSSCSATYFDDVLQGLGSGSENCLTDYPYLELAGYGSIGYTSTCGNGIVDTGEDCDTGGIHSDICTDTCKFFPGVVCVGGDCCTSAGQFKRHGTACRETIHECDLIDMCPGNNATCGTNHKKPNGSPCVESGPVSVCWDGLCYGLDMQCFSSWYHYGSEREIVYIENACSVNNSLCGDLHCMSETGISAGECTTVNDGSSSLGIKMRIANHSPCGANKTCSNGACVNSFNLTCSCINGECNQFGDCVCDHGWSGTNCTTYNPCGVDCASLNRKNCVDLTTAELCGNCLPGYYQEEAKQEINEKCRLQSSSVSRNVTSADHLTESGIAKVINLFDGNKYTVWIESFTSTDLAWAEIYFDDLVPITTYELISGGSLPSQDPSDWILYGCKTKNTTNTGCSDDNWIELDRRTLQLFHGRRTRRQYIIKDEFWGNFFYSYRFVVTRISSGASIGFVQMSELQIYTGGDPAGSSSSSSSAGLSNLTIVSIVASCVVAVSCFAAIMTIRKYRNNVNR